MKFKHDPSITGELKGSDWVCYPRKNDPHWYVLRNGDKAVLDPESKSKASAKVRGRHCVVLDTNPFGWGKVQVRFLESNRIAWIMIHDLLPLPAEVININQRRQLKND